MAKSLSFEQQLSMLEDIVQRLEKGDLSLEESLKQFEKGVGLTQKCQDLLNQAEQKITRLTETKNTLPASSPSDSDT